MFVDAMLLVSDAQAITVTAFSTNTIDLGNPTVKNRIGTGEKMAFGLQVDVAADFTTTDETYRFDIVSSANANLSTPTILASITLLASQLAINKKFALPVPAGMPSQRYIGLQYTVGGTTPTITVTAFLSPASMIDAEYTFYPKGYSS